MVLDDGNQTVTRRLTLLDSGNGSGLRNLQKVLSNTTSQNKKSIYNNLLKVSSNTTSQNQKSIYNNLLKVSSKISSPNKNVIYNDLQKVVKKNSSDEIKFIKLNTSTKIMQLNTPVQDTSLGIVIGNRGPEFVKSIPDSNVFVGDTVVFNLNEYFGNDDSSFFDHNLDCYWININDSILTMIPEFEETVLIKVSAVDCEDNELFAESNDFSLTAVYSNHAPVLVVPAQIVKEDSNPKHLLNLSDYVSDAEDDSASFSLVSQSNPELANVSLNSDSLRLTYLQPDGFGESIIGVSASDGELSDTAYFTLKVSPVADITFKHVHFKTGEELTNNTFTINDSAYTSVDSVKLQLDSDSLSLDVLHDDYWSYYFWVSKDSLNGNVAQKDAMNPCNLSLDSLDQTLYIHSIADTVDLGNIVDMIDSDFPRGLDRFVTDTLTVWVKQGYDIPDSATLEYLKEVTLSDGKDGIRYISNYDFATNFKVFGSTKPDNPYIKVRFDKGFPHPGAHGEYVNFETNEVDSASLIFDTDVTKHDIMAEIRQTLHQRTDSPSGWGWAASDPVTGRPIYSVKMHDLGVIAYSFEPGTAFKIWSKSASTTATPAPEFDSVYKETFRRSD